MLARKIAAVVSQPNILLYGPLICWPITARLFVINIIRRSSGGVENPWTIPAVTRAFIGLIPIKLMHIAINVKITIAV